MLSEKEVLHLLEETQAVLHGHFLLTSGLHSPMYVEKFNVLQHPAYTEKLWGTRAIFTERENGKMTLKRGFQIPEGCRVLVVEDIVTTGGSVKEVMDVVREHGGNVIGVGLLVDRSGGKVDFGVRTEALLHLDVPTFKAEDCPLCHDGVELTKRGSTGKNNPVKK